MDKATQTQLSNIEKRTGKTLAELTSLARNCGLTKHGEIRDLLKRDLGMGHGDANAVVHLALKPADEGAGDVPGAIYSGSKAALRPIHDKLMAAIEKFGEFEVAPKKTYVSLRRKKQFAMIGPATNTRVEVGLNVRTLTAAGRLEAMPPMSMCQYKVKVTDPAEVDAELIGWIRAAFDAAG